MMQQDALHSGNYSNRSALLRNTGIFIRPSGIIAIDEDFDTPFNIDASSPRYEPGMRLTVGRVLGRDAANRDHILEVSYLGLFEWTPEPASQVSLATRFARYSAASRLVARERLSRH